MHARAQAIGRAVLPHIDLERCGTLLDIGGGPGTFAVMFANAFPHLACTVMDLPEILEIAEELIAEQGMGHRVRTFAGDYHTTTFPGENDVVTIFGVLHQESGESIRHILRRAYEALSPGGKIHIMDMMTDASHTAPKFSALFAVNMALTTDSGWVFSDEELKGWLEEVGFKSAAVRSLPPPMPHWLATAQKP
jgi:cyclopropane fatty-acyl-phospholipid synthase-like methyltransferase